MPNSNEAAGTEKGYEMFFEGISYNCPALKMYGFPDELALRKAIQRRVRMNNRNRARRERDQAMRDLGLTRVRGSLGGVYWE